MNNTKHSKTTLAPIFMMGHKRRIEEGMTIIVGMLLGMFPKYKDMSSSQRFGRDLVREDGL